MSPRIAFYRLYRLRRLIVSAWLLPLAIVALMAVLRGPATLWLVPLAVLPPIAHALLFPKATSETLALSLALVPPLALAATIGPDVGVPGLALRILGLGVLAAAMFVALVGRVPEWLERGPRRSRVLRARRRSHLDPATLKRAITLYPGRDDGLVTCGPANADGLFEIRFRHRMGTMSPEGVIGCDVVVHGMVHHDTPGRFELFCLAGGEQHEERTRFEFRPIRGGTRVTITEAGAPMPFGHWLGFWLTDYMADYLTDEVDRAEGRPMRANRFQVHDQLIVLMVRRFFPRGPQSQDPGAAG